MNFKFYSVLLFWFFYCETHYIDYISLYRFDNELKYVMWHFVSSVSDNMANVRPIMCISFILLESRNDNVDDIRYDIRRQFF